MQKMNLAQKYPINKNQIFSPIIMKLGQKLPTYKLYWVRNLKSGFLLKAYS